MVKKNKPPPTRHEAAVARIPQIAEEMDYYRIAVRRLEEV